MSLLQDSTVVTTGCKQHKKRIPCYPSVPKDISRLSSLLKYSPIPSLSSIFSGAGGDTNSYEDGFGKEDAEKRLQDEVDKRILRLRMRNVSFAIIYNPIRTITVAN